jgi:NAD(P)-dependent dehydrogenase (short-subunit alcohol dehydrogenase family)
VIETSAWLAPGGVADQIAADSGKTAAEVLDEARAMVPTARLGTEEEVAPVIAFLCSELAASITGAGLGDRRRLRPHDDLNRPPSAPPPRLLRAQVNSAALRL